MSITEECVLESPLLMKKFIDANNLSYYVAYLRAKSFETLTPEQWAALEKMVDDDESWWKTLRTCVEW
ncbi:lipase chaperone [Zavarzinella formosa]|uniref:lipase chaperone n=1 Tax=Zavarzinella formosa TaxID=360055 RepID=UPI0002F60D55|nr:lipase chaperone [Zavarzinella formosa]